MTANISVKMNQFVQQCKAHNPFANIDKAPKIHPALKVVCLIPLIGSITAVILRSNNNFNPNSIFNHDRKIEVLRADRRLHHVEMACAVTSVAIAVTLLAVGILGAGACFGISIMLAGVAYGVYRYAAIHNQIQKIQAEQQQANAAL
jgi:hypothetical protein